MFGTTVALGIVMFTVTVLVLVMVILFARSKHLALVTTLIRCSRELLRLWVYRYESVRYAAPLTYSRALS